jgi:protein-S-isoprenylcysteine O-methyltransferase Ste14
MRPGWRIIAGAASIGLGEASGSGLSGRPNVLPAPLWPGGRPRPKFAPVPRRGHGMTRVATNRITGAAAPFWELITRISISVYFGWIGLSAADQQVRWALNQDFGKLAAADLLDFTAETVGIFFQLAIAILIVMRYRRVAATGGLYPRLVALLGSFLFLLLVPFLSRHELSPTLDFLSILLMLSGSILATMVLLCLGRSFSILPEARRLVVTEPYRLVRHPLYATEMILMLGFMMQFTLWPSVIVFLIQLIIQLERMRIEEELLNKTFPEYEIYARNTARLIPGLYWHRFGKSCPQQLTIQN